MRAQFYHTFFHHLHQNDLVCLPVAPLSYEGREFTLNKPFCDWFFCADELNRLFLWVGLNELFTPDVDDITGLLKIELLLLDEASLSVLSLLKMFPLPCLLKLLPLNEFKFPEVMPLPVCEPKWLPPPFCEYIPELELETFLGEIGFSEGLVKSLP